MSLTRRALLKLIAASAATATLAPVLHARAYYPPPPEPEDANAWLWLGRAIHAASFYEQPALSAARVATRQRDQAFIILGEERAPFSAHNDLWYKTNFGYVHSAWIQPMRIYPPQPFVPAPSGGFVGEVSQVFTAAYAQPSLQSTKRYRLYGNTVYSVLDALKDERGIGWYKIYDDFPPSSPSHQWVLARDMRRIPPEEISPIHPFAGKKRIEVSLAKCILACYEGDRKVFTTRIAPGIEHDETGTPRGDMAVLLKQPSRHMSNAEYTGGPPLVGDFFDLPGVPWNTFFDLAGTAIHGTYWHNDFGVQRSHGCVNVAIEAARWVYRWVHPFGGYQDAYVQSDQRVGTPIIIS